MLKMIVAIAAVLISGCGVDADKATSAPAPEIYPTGLLKVGVSGDGFAVGITKGEIYLFNGTSVASIETGDNQAYDIELGKSYALAFSDSGLYYISRNMIRWVHIDGKIVLESWPASDDSAYVLLGGKDGSASLHLIGPSSESILFPQPLIK